MKKLKSFISLDLFFILLEVIILFIMIFFQIKTIVTNHDAVKYASLYYPMVDISKIFLIALPTLWILSYFFSYVHDDHQLIDKQNLLVIYLILGLLANIFSIVLSSYPILFLISFLLSYLLICFILLEDKKEILVHLLCLILFFIICLLIPSLRTYVRILSALCFSLLVSNLSLTIYKYIKTKDKYYLYFIFAIIFALISDASLGLRAILSNEIINNIFSFLVWPTYVINLILIIYIYNIHHKKLST